MLKEGAYLKSGKIQQLMPVASFWHILSKASWSSMALFIALSPVQRELKLPKENCLGLTCSARSMTHQMAKPGQVVHLRREGLSHCQTAAQMNRAHQLPYVARHGEVSSAEFESESDRRCLLHCLSA